MEAFNTSGRVNQLLFSRKERMAGRTEFQPDFLFGGASFKLVAAGAGNNNVMVFGMNSFFHINLILRAHSNGAHVRKRKVYHQQSFPATQFSNTKNKSGSESISGSIL
jgi:hypothetical protein